jgi:hypothetical protein
MLTPAFGLVSDLQLTLIFPVAICFLRNISEGSAHNGYRLSVQLAGTAKARAGGAIPAKASLPMPTNQAASGKL